MVTSPISKPKYLKGRHSNALQEVFVYYQLMVMMNLFYSSKTINFSNRHIFDIKGLFLFNNFYANSLIQSMFNEK